MTHKPTATPTAPASAVLYVTEDIAATRYSISVNSLRRLRYAGKLKAVALGPKLVRYNLASLDAYFAALAKGGDGNAAAAPRGKCNAWRARRNLRPTAPVAQKHPAAPAVTIRDTSPANA